MFNILTSVLLNDRYFDQYHTIPFVERYNAEERPACLLSGVSVVVVEQIAIDNEHGYNTWTILIIHITNGSLVASGLLPTASMLLLLLIQKTYQFIDVNGVSRSHKTANIFFSLDSVA